ncbi:ParB/RepB/Spo0J family partition protein [Caballeronia sp. LP006]|uniref:ParB/RepB/Spo0J family partition protein n=1 Tax=Caballeronia sp. LP006 TaxID=3038552 RepID=UPI00286224BB|nr:ParB/RepB/Spo0J family partition protein [Caballeronia sp. LP006]MDR5830100.1 ParB/RepB/Spo0J family partition protein [Caballeronia sp. LP006]
MKPNPGTGLRPKEETIETLKFHWSKPKISETGIREIPVSKLVVCPKAFQMRRVDPRSRTGVSDPAHVTKLRERLGREGALDPIRVLPISYGRFVVFDGFHRAHAYKLEGRETVPADVFGGTPSEAKMEAAKENDKVKKELTNTEKSEYLWTMLCERPSDTLTGKRWTLAQCAEAAKCSLSKAEKIEKQRRKFLDANLPVPARWIDVIATLHEHNAEEFSKSVREMGDKLKEILGPLDTPGKLRKAAKAIRYASERAGELARDLVEETDSYEALHADLEERVAGACEEAVSEAQEAWKHETGSAVNTLRDQVGAVEKHMRDLKVHGSLTRLIFGSAREAASIAEYRQAILVA